SVVEVEEGLAADALLHQVDAAAIGREVLLLADERLVLRIFPAHLRREGMLAAGGGVEVAADGEEAVAELFGVEAAAIEVPQILVLRVLERALGVEGAGGLIGAAQHDHAVEPLDTPAALEETRREVVEQFGMCGRLAARTEIVGGRADALPEVHLPDAIDDHTRGRWIVARRDPLGELEASAALLFGRQLLPAENGEESAGHFRTKLVRLAPHHDLRVYRL